jgi:hypothetical protein
VSDSPRGLIVPLTRSQAVARLIEYANDKRCKYDLGEGGTDPARARPWNDQGELDCSGFTSWANGHDRLQLAQSRPDIPLKVAPEHHWVSTASLRVHGAWGLYERIEWGELDEGDLVVYAAAAGVRKYGHVGGVVHVPELGSPDAKEYLSRRRWWKELQVAHCHGPGGRQPGIEITDGRYWRHRWGAPRGTVFLRYLRYVAEPT